MSLSGENTQARTRDDNVAPAGAEAPADAPGDFDALVSDILENPEILLKSDLTSEQILEIQKRLNPYAGIAGPAPGADRKRVAAVSYTNLREDYLRRLTATSLVGFLFQVFHEWEVPAEQRRWTPPTAAPKKDDPNYQPFAVAALVERLEATLAIAREAQAATEQAAAAKRGASEMDVVLPGNASAEQRRAVETKYAEAETLAAKSAGLLYAATHATHRAGAEAGVRLRATAEAGMKFPDVKEILSRHPLPAPPGQVEMPAAVAKEAIGAFLRNWLEFDPSVHVRSGHDAKTIAAAVEQVRVGDRAVAVDSKDPGHLTLEAVRAAAPRPAAEHKDAYETIVASKRAYDAVAALLRDEDLVEAALTALDAGDAFRQYLFPVPKDSAARPAADVVPPQDTFHRWAYYTEVNYEELRTVTEALYPERPDLDWAIALWDVFEGSEKEVDAAFEKHCQRYQDEVPSAIKALEFGSWSLLADFKENRKKIQFYNKNTEVLKRILDRHADDKRIGAELMRNRVRQTKARNIASEGPDASGLSQYKRNVSEKGQDLAGKGVEKVISVEEMRRLEKAGGSIKAAKELELLEQYEATIKGLGEMEKLRPLTTDEARDLAHARDNVERVREMVAVPDDAIQVDIFTSNPATGEFGKSHFYTKAVAPDQLSAANQAGAAPSGSEHPAAVRSTPMPQYAPYAVDHILSEAAPRSDSDRKAEALRDADASGNGK
jgi:hypothetical protein